MTKRSLPPSALYPCEEFRLRLDDPGQRPSCPSSPNLKVVEASRPVDDTVPALRPINHALKSFWPFTFGGRGDCVAANTDPEGDAIASDAGPVQATLFSPMIHEASGTLPLIYQPDVSLVCSITTPFRRAGVLIARAAASYRGLPAGAPVRPASVIPRQTGFHVQATSSSLRQRLGWLRRRRH